MILMHIPYEEMVEPLEETRNELIFATEPILSSLQLSIPGSSRYSPLVELDEIEVCCTDIVLFYSMLMHRTDTKRHLAVMQRP